MQRPTGLQSTFENAALALVLVMLWLLMHGYHGLTGDGQIYAFQAMATLHPHLASDLYLQNTSQDRFTVFSPVYAWCIELLGLEDATRLLTLLFTLWLLAAVWDLARALVGKDAAWGTVALLLISAGNYGGSGVFHLLEPFLTARLPAQALIVTGLLCQVRKMPWAALALALAALLIHPLMALPGLLLMLCLRLSFRQAVIGAISSVIAIFAVAVAAVEVPALSHVFPVMDAAWLNVVRERSQFLFLQLWSARDWESNAQPFVCLGFIAIAVPYANLRRLCQAAALVGAAGFAVAFIGGLIGPVAILVQGQAWRWIWITELITLVLLPFTAMQAARDDKCGLLCAVLLVLGWTEPGIAGMAGVAFASLLWLTRARISPAVAGFLRWGSAAIAVAAGAWLFTKSWAILSATATPASGTAELALPRLREILALETPALLLCALIAWRLRLARSAWGPLLLNAVLIGLSVFILPAAFKQPRLLAAPTDIQKFADWSERIPPTSTVLVAPPRDVGAFVWFTLDRPNYLSLDQSAGVVFSRATALEVQRRSQVLLPLMDPDWKLLTRLRSASVSAGKPGGTRRLTSMNLMQICADPLLGFVVSPEKVGFDATPHLAADALKDWNLYDCRKVRSVT